MIDREHILPKSKPEYKDYTFALWNLAVACKRCNMQFKGRKTVFIRDPVGPSFPSEAADYLFIHPNFDEWEHHLSRVVIQQDRAVLVHYTVRQGSVKGEYTLGFFALRDLETNSYDQGQKGEADDDTPSSRGALAVARLARSFNQ